MTEKEKAMVFDLTKCIGFVTDTSIKCVSEDFNRRLESQGSTRIQWVAMYFLRMAKKPLRQNELAVMMNLKNSTLARLIDRMERDGLLSRVESETDKRVNYLELTENGKNKVDELMPVGEYFNQLLLKGISDEEVKVFESVLAKMLANIQE
jgi:DNA-binding MarR family transcriptional regulator